MLRIFSGRECYNREKFMYDEISKELAGGVPGAYVVVPNQYTLVAEEQALKYLNASCLYNVEIMSMQRLGLRILGEAGKENVPMLSQYGRLMLLTRIINENKDDLKLFAAASNKRSFAAMLSDFISSFKQQDCAIDQIQTMLEDENANPLLKSKLAELQGIVESYEKSIDGKYIDSEDYISMYVDEIPNSHKIEGKSIWIYGYDSVTPKFARAMAELTKKAKDVNIIFSESDYNLERKMVALIKRVAEDEGVACEFAMTEWSDYKKQCSETVAWVEKGLFAEKLNDEDKKELESFEPEDLKVVQCANYYYEAESAAAFIHTLIRDKGYKLSDIAIICNDEKIRTITQRILLEYEIPCFLDSNKGIRDAACVSFIEHMVACMARGWNTNWILSMLKTGLTDIKREEISLLENYAREYGIRGNMWAKPFKYHRSDVSEERFEELEALRSKVMTSLLQLKDMAKESTTVSDFIVAFLAYLESEWSLEDRNESLAISQEENGLAEEAMKARQSLDEAIKLLDQMNEIMGECPFNAREFYEIYLVGLESTEVGVLPPSADGVAMGTMIRTRPRPAKAVIVIAANEGILPMQVSTEGLFSIDEKNYFVAEGFALGGLDDTKMLEENVAMYRMMALPLEKLYVSYSMSDTEGKEKIPSPLVDALHGLFPRLSEDSDIVSNGWGIDLVNGSNETLRHLIDHIKTNNESGEVDSLADVLVEWFEKNEPEKFAQMKKLSLEENDVKPIGKDLAKALYARGNGDYVFSASQFDTYYMCPYSYFVGRGLSPREERRFESDPRAIGDVYHNCLMEVGQRLKVAKSDWKEASELSDEALRTLIHDIIQELAIKSEGGLFLSTGAEQYRVQRIEDICFGAARAMLLQLGTGSVEEVCFEEDFGRGKRFEPISMNIAGQDVYIEGRIDRVDLFKGNRVRVIDYKTGTKSVNPEEIEQGYNMQLMIYMLTATGDKEPAGLFYFNIKDPMTKVDAIPDEEEPIEKSFKLSGKYVDEAGVIDMMPLEAIANSSRSLHHYKLERPSYDDLANAVTERLSELGEDLMDGKINVSPLVKNRVRVGCKFCDYNAICKFDREYSGNKARVLKTKKKEK